MEAATAMATATTVEAAATTTVEAAATTTVEAAATTAVGASSTAATVTAAMLGKSGDGRANECKRSDTCKKILEQGGFPHICTPPPKRRLTGPGGHTASDNFTSNWNPIPDWKLHRLDKKSGDGVR